MVFWEVLFSRHLITHIWPSIPFRKIRLFSNFDVLAGKGAICPSYIFTNDLDRQPRFPHSDLLR